MKCMQLLACTGRIAELADLGGAVEAKSQQGQGLRALPQGHLGSQGDQEGVEGYATAGTPAAGPQ